MSKYQSTPHSTFNLGYHVVFCTKYRYRLLRYGAAVTLKNLFLQKAEQLGIAIRAMEIMPEHVHLFLALKPAMRIDSVVRKLKGYSSYHMRLRYAYLRKYPSLWTRSYFVESVGNISEKTVVKYIENQKSKALSFPG